MSRSTEYITAFFIFVSALLGATAVMLTPALFEEFHAGRLTAVVTLLAITVAFGAVAKRNRAQLTR